MADNAPKIYCGNGKRKTFNWGSIVEMSMDLDTLVEQFNQHGYVNSQGKRVIKVTLSQRKEEGTYGETHYSTVNTWHPAGFVKPDPVQLLYTDKLNGAEEKHGQTTEEDIESLF